MDVPELLLEESESLEESEEEESDEDEESESDRWMVSYCSAKMPSKLSMYSFFSRQNLWGRSGARHTHGGDVSTATGKPPIASK
ncbi:hypothetical protein EYF80_046842 [Liparis tanakae]|uniref:Uncharacterized protein n=1 Tax=Liparis tanakae TaxID=230148 RepID=A0A4Z2FRE3_9TELE|nr:hypothetical protein EYF80_046842 [Liparis tanakae]